MYFSIRLSFSSWACAFFPALFLFLCLLIPSYLGGKPIWNFLTANNALPRTNGLRQPVHKDITFYHPQCPFFVIANIPLCDFSPVNGSTEFWLGSHSHTTGHDQVIATTESTLANARLVAGDQKPSSFLRSENSDAEFVLRFSPSVRKAISCFEI